MTSQRALQPTYLKIHIYIKNGVRNGGNQLQFRRATTTLLAAQKLL